VYLLKRLQFFIYKKTITAISLKQKIAEGAIKNHSIEKNLLFNVNNVEVIR
jgi:hypothetical protein